MLVEIDQLHLAGHRDVIRRKACIRISPGRANPCHLMHQQPEGPLLAVEAAATGIDHEAGIRSWRTAIGICSVHEAGQEMAGGRKSGIVRDLAMARMTEAIDTTEETWTEVESADLEPVVNMIVGHASDHLGGRILAFLALQPARQRLQLILHPATLTQEQNEWHNELDPTSCEDHRPC